ncbi:TPA: O-antigen ligase domain-containing protein, partial [Streptococcus pneumoniae]
MHVRLDGLLDYIFLFSVIITCNTMYSTSQGFDGLGKWATLLLVVSVFLKLLISRISMKAINVIVSRSLIFILIILLIVILNGFKISETSFVYYFVLFPIFMMILQMYYDVNEIANLIRKFVRIIFLLAIGSLLFWLIGSVFHIISPTVYVLN